MELVSPILSPTPAEQWAGSLETIFAVLRRHFVVAPSAHAGTHVHVSTEPAALGSASGVPLAAVAKAALYFEPALDALLPSSRSSSGGGSGSGSGSGSNGSSGSSGSGGNGTGRGGGGGGGPYWCQSNRASVAMRGLSGLGECFALLDSCCYGGDGGGGDAGDGNYYYCYNGDGGVATTATGNNNNNNNYYYNNDSGAEQVVRAMCLFPASSAYGRAHGYTSDFVHGVYKWNFSGLIPATGSGTLEYRQVGENFC